VTPSALFLMAPGQSDPRALMIFMVQIGIFFAIVYFMLIRPKMQQEKTHKSRLAGIKAKDEIVTVGGIIGEVIHIKEDRVTIRSGESRLVIQRDRVAEVRTPNQPESTATP
jgi:preprotein translocase subunit YajC